VEGRLGLDPAIASYHAAGQTLTLFLKAPMGRQLKGAAALSFLIRSSLARKGSVEIQDDGNGLSYYAELSVTGSWTRVRIPFTDLLSAEERSLADAEKVTDRPRLQIALELPPEEVEKAAAAGTLGFMVDLDSLALER